MIFFRLKHSPLFSNYRNFQRYQQRKFQEDYRKMQFNSPTGSEEEFHKFIEDATLFLKEFKWLIDFKWTEVFLPRVVDKIPLDWHLYLNAMDINRLKQIVVSMESEIDTPESLGRLIKRCKELSPRLEFPYHTNYTEAIHEHKTSVKKTQEANHFVQFLDGYIKERKESKDVTVIDVGAGLGYVSKKLCNRGYPVIGIECRSELCCSVNSNNSEQNLKFVERKIDDSQECLELLEDLVPESTDGVLIGLHSCGDLLYQMINLYAKSKRLKSVCCVTCCYHAMSLDQFPRSKMCQNILNQNKFEFTRVILRLGCQETPIRWTHELTPEKQDAHAKVAAFRGILEEVLLSNPELKWKRLRRKNILRNDMNDFIEDNIHGFPEEQRTRARILLQQNVRKRSSQIDLVKTLKVSIVLLFNTHNFSD